MCCSLVRPDLILQFDNRVNSYSSEMIELGSDHLLLYTTHVDIILENDNNLLPTIFWLKIVQINIDFEHI